MNRAAFDATLNQSDPPPMTSSLRALWYARQGDWDTAHRIVQDDSSTDAAWIHAHLHRVEGDLGNARYWYNRAGKPFPDGTELDTEWTQLVDAFVE